MHRDTQGSVLLLERVAAFAVTVGTAGTAGLDRLGRSEAADSYLTGYDHLPWLVLTFTDPCAGMLSRLAGAIALPFDLSL